MGKVLYALDETISDFLESMQNSLDSEARLAITNVNDGARILANFFYRLSLTKRA